MSIELDLALAPVGTRFRLFAQARYLPAFSVPETVVVSVPPSAILPGPEDDRMFVVDAVNKKQYGSFGALQPQQFGNRRPSVGPGQDGHFDKIDPDSREFASAAMYATVRRGLDIWQDYCGLAIPWISRADFPKLILIPLLEWNNAHSGYGFIEFGYGRDQFGNIDHNSPHCLNFDVLLHELMHNLLFTLLGLPNDASNTPYFGGLHESVGDLGAVISVLHFHSVVDHILEQSRGNLFAVNELSRLGEAANGEEIRTAFNSLKMSDVGNEPHDLSQPLTGACFDVFIDHFQRGLVEAGLITEQLAARSQYGRATGPELDVINHEFAKAYEGQEEGFKTALLVSRDYLGRLLAKTWQSLSPHYLTYPKILLAMLDADAELSQGANSQSIRECFAWREISGAPVNPNLLSRNLEACGMSRVRNSANNAMAQPHTLVTHGPHAFIEAPVAAPKAKKR